MFLHDIIKIHYSREGFLPDYPYHLISDEEMFEAFIGTNSTSACFFQDTYACPDPSLQIKYNELVTQIKYHINQYLTKVTIRLPNWVYSYMLGAVIATTSDAYDIEDLMTLLNLNTDKTRQNDELTLEAYNSIYDVSCKYVRKLKQVEQLHRPPTIFGEPHVIKILRLEQSEVKGG